MVNQFSVMACLCVVMTMNVTLAWSEPDMPKFNAERQRLYSAIDVSSFDVKYVDKTVHLVLSKRVNGVESIWYQFSSDEGVTWSDAVNITQGLSIETRVRRGNDVRFAVQGPHIVAVWMSRKEGARHHAGPMVAMASHDRGKTWQQMDSPADWDGAHGFFAMDGNADEMSLVWLDSRTKKGDGATQGLRFAKSIDGGMSWSANQTLDERSCACCWNTAQYHGDTFYILYRDKDPSDMRLGKVDADQQWQALSTVGKFGWDFQGCPHIGGSLAFDRQRALIHSTVGTGHADKTGTYYLRSHDRGTTWTLPHRLGGETAVHSDVAVSSHDGTVLATWDRISESGFQIMAAASYNQGQTWSQQTLLSTPGIRASHPRVVAMESGFLVLWTENNTQRPSILQAVKVD